MAVVLAAALFAPVLAALGAATGRASAVVAAFVVLAIATAVLCRAPLRYVMSITPMAFGVVDRPLENKVPLGDVELSGWAIGDQGVAGVELVVDGRTTVPASYGLPYRGARGESLALYFPGYPQTPDAG